MSMNKLRQRRGVWFWHVYHITKTFKNYLKHSKTRCESSFFFHGASSTFSLKHHSHHQKHLWSIRKSSGDSTNQSMKILQKSHQDLGVSKNRGKLPPKMDGLWKTLLKWMIWGAHPYFRKHPYLILHQRNSTFTYPPYVTRQTNEAIPPFVILLGLSAATVPAAHVALARDIASVWWCLHAAYLLMFQK